MNYKEAVIELNKYQTKNGNYKKEAVLRVIEQILSQNQRTMVKCPKCNGTGKLHSPCAFGGSGDTWTCDACNGKGKI